MLANAFDHVALWAHGRAELSRVLIAVSGMHEIEQTESFTLVGGDARAGKITLFDAPGLRDRGVLDRVVIRVPTLGRSAETLAANDIEFRWTDQNRIHFVGPADVPFALVQGPGPPDLEGVELVVDDRTATIAALHELGFDGGDVLELGGRIVSIRAGDAAETTRPLLNHLALLVDSAEETHREALARCLEIDRVVDAPNTRAVFVQGPAGILLEYVEHKPSFALH